MRSYDISSSRRVFCPVFSTLSLEFSHFAPACSLYKTAVLASWLFAFNQLSVEKVVHKLILQGYMQCSHNYKHYQYMCNCTYASINTHVYIHAHMHTCISNTRKYMDKYIFINNIDKCSRVFLSLTLSCFYLALLFIFVCLYMYLQIAKFEKMTFPGKFIC